MHPLVHDLDQLKDSELENKISDLTRKYFATPNFEVKNQISMILDSYRDELSRRQRVAYERLMKNHNKDLDKLIKVN